jgi:predicted ester cyclase
MPTRLKMVFIRAPFPPVVGIEANRKSDEETMGAFSDWEVIIHDLLAEDDVVVMTYTFKAVNTGDLLHLGVPATGKAVESTACGVFYFQGDKIAKMVHYFDMLGFLSQLGLIPAMA